MVLIKDKMIIKLIKIYINMIKLIKLLYLIIDLLKNKYLIKLLSLVYIKKIYIILYHSVLILQSIIKFKIIIN